VRLKIGGWPSAPGEIGTHIVIARSLAFIQVNAQARRLGAQKVARLVTEPMRSVPPIQDKQRDRPWSRGIAGQAEHGRGNSGPQITSGAFPGAWRCARNQGNALRLEARPGRRSWVANAEAPAQGEEVVLGAGGDAI